MSELPRHIGRYRVEAVLGRGAMGVIYRARDPEIDRIVALKLIQADLLAGEERAGTIARFRREAQAAGRCMHPNIVAIYDFAMHEGNPFIAMEFVDGVTLAQAREPAAKFDPADAVFVVLQVLDALGAAHAVGVVHRDIKPANIMLVRGSHVKVADFGISRLESAGVTLDGNVVGTPSYMSPEQARGQTVDLRSDLFSTSVVLFEMLCGAKPFPGRNVAEVLSHLLTPEPVDLTMLDALPAGLREVMTRGLAKAVDARFVSASAMAAALRQAMAGTQADLSDRTIALPSRPHPGPDPLSDVTGTSAFDSATLETLERRLTELVGPIARHLVQSAVRRGGSMDSLCASLAASINRPGDRQAFEQEARRHLELAGQLASSTAAVPSRTTASQVRLQLSPDEVTRIEKALTHHLGPVARVLVKRGLTNAPSVGALWHGLAQHIDQTEARAAFLRQQE